MGKTIRAQMPGTFYRRPEPGSDPFIEEGAEVSAGETVGLIEVMKNFREVKAEEGGKVVKFLVEDEEAVDAGQDLAEIE